MKYVVDVDGTICSLTNSNYPAAKPFQYRIDYFNNLYDIGHEVHYWTARGGVSGIDWFDLTAQQLADWGVKYTSFATGKRPYDVIIDDKAFNADQFFHAIAKKKVFVNGTFDILHKGHLSMLRYAKSLGHVTVGIDSDRRVKTLKGDSRPVNSASERKEMLESLKFVDRVEIFDTDEELIKLIASSDLMVKGADYKDKPIVGQDVCKELVFFDILNGHSTTEKIKRITGR